MNQPVNPQITDAVTQMARHCTGIADNLSTLLSVLAAFKSQQTPLTTASTWQGLSQEDRQLIVMCSRDAVSAMMMTEDLLRKKNQ